MNKSNNEVSYNPHTGPGILFSADPAKKQALWPQGIHLPKYHLCRFPAAHLQSQLMSSFPGVARCLWRSSEAAWDPTTFRCPSWFVPRIWEHLKGGTSPTLKTIHQTKLSFQKLESWGLDVRQLLSFFQRAQTHGICIISQQQLLQTTVTPPRFRGLLPPYPGATGTTLTVPLRDGALLQIPIWSTTQMTTDPQP